MTPQAFERRKQALEIKRKRKARAEEKNFLRELQKDFREISENLPFSEVTPEGWIISVVFDNNHMSYAHKIEEMFRARGWLTKVNPFIRGIILEKEVFKTELDRLDSKEKNKVLEELGWALLLQSPSEDK